MGQKIYVIRRLAYWYSDEYFYISTLGSVEGRFTDEAQAQQRLMELEVPMFRTRELGGIDRMLYWTDRRNEENNALVDQYLKDTIGESIYERTPSTNDLYIPYMARLSDKLTDAQIMKIRELSGVRFHDIYVFEDDVKFYAIWIPEIQKFHQMDYEGGASVFFFNTYDEAMIYACRVDSVPIRFIGTYEELSDQPALLQSYVETTPGLEYSEKWKTLEKHYKFDPTKFGALNALLKKPAVEIRELSYDQVKDMPHEPYEYI